MKREEKPPDSDSASDSANPSGSSSGAGTIDDPIIISGPENTPQSSNFSFWEGKVKQQIFSITSCSNSSTSRSADNQFVAVVGDNSASIIPPRGHGRNVNSGNLYRSVGQRGYISSNLRWQRPNRSSESRGDGTLNLLRALESERIETTTNSNRAQGQPSRSQQQLDGRFLSLASFGTTNDASERSLKRQMETSNKWKLSAMESMERNTFVQYPSGSNAVPRSRFQTNIHQVASPPAGPSQAGQSAATGTRIASQLQNSPTPSTRQTHRLGSHSFSGARQSSSTANQNALRRQNSHRSSLGPQHQRHQGPTDWTQQQRVVSQPLANRPQIQNCSDRVAEALQRNRLLQYAPQHAIQNGNAQLQPQQSQNAPPMPRIRATGLPVVGNQVEPVGHSCRACRLDLSLTPTGSVTRLGDYPDTDVFPCGHTFHHQCLERIYPSMRYHNPGCPVCAGDMRPRSA